MEIIVVKDVGLVKIYWGPAVMEGLMPNSVLRIFFPTSGNFPLTVCPVIELGQVTDWRSILKAVKNLILIFLLIGVNSAILQDFC